MEILGFLFIIFLIWMFFKALSVGVFVLTLPLKIIGAVFLAVISVILLVPLGVITGLISGLIGLLVLPFALLIPIIPVILVIAGIYLLLKNS